jgi:hemerythrin-like metal-binding protein
MAEYHYEPLEAHRAKHEHFKEILSDLELEFREEGPTQNLVEACSKLLVNWLLQHIREVDTEFGAFLKSRNIVLPE